MCIRDSLDYLADHEVLHRVSEADEERYYWQADSYPCLLYTSNPVRCPGFRT